MSTAKHTAGLEEWSSIADGTEWPTLLVGNGASINLWTDFDYRSLYKQADLSPAAKAVFAELEVENFEMVLEAIHHAHVVVGALGNLTEDIDKQYTEVKEALFNAVRDAHIERFRFTDATFDTIAGVLQGHNAVYTTNYDLCMYWARLDASKRIKGREVIDFFWNDFPEHTFNPDSVEVRGRIPTYYLHGAIHLWQDDHGTNGKWTTSDRGRLLSLAGQYSPESGRWPLFVSEASAKAKIQTIRRSPYLSFCLDALRADHGNTVILGHSLEKSDSHIVAALNEGDRREVAVSIYPHRNRESISQETARITALLGRNKPRFFDSTTHPLGNQSLTIQKPFDLV